MGPASRGHVQKRRRAPSPSAFFCNYIPCLTRSASSADLASFHWSMLPTRYPVIRRMRSKLSGQEHSFRPQPGHSSSMIPVYPQQGSRSTGWFTEPYPMPASFMQRTTFSKASRFFSGSPSIST